MNGSSVYHDSTNSTADCTVDNSFRLELVPLPAWSQSLGNESPILSIAPQKWPWVVTILGELRQTDNIFVTEIGKSGLLEFLQGGVMACSNRFTSHDNEDQIHHCHWEFQDDACFRYLMEILQANIIYFLKRRYFDMERCRETSHDQRATSTASIAEDFQSIFGKASSTRYLANRERVALNCFKETYHQQKGRSFLAPEAIQKALARLHHRAGIYLPERLYTSHYEIDSYWIDLWWVCSTLLLWILEPCLEITVSLEIDPYQLQKKQRVELPTAMRAYDATGFVKQSQQVAKIPFRLIRANTEKLGLVYDKVLLHEGPWDEEEADEDFVLPIDIEHCRDEDDDSESASDNSDAGIAIVAKILADAKQMSRNLEAKQLNYGEGDGIGSNKRKEAFQVQANEQWEWKNRKRRYSAHDHEVIDETRLKAVYDSFWANGNEDLDAVDIGGNPVETCGI